MELCGEILPTSHAPYVLYSVKFLWIVQVKDFQGNNFRTSRKSYCALQNGIKLAEPNLCSPRPIREKCENYVP